MTKQREGVIVDPVERLNEKQIDLIDGVSRDLLQNPGLLCYNKEATEVFRQAGAEVQDEGDCQRVKLNNSLLDHALDTTPPAVVLGARNPDNRLVLDATEPRVRFVSGSETNIWLEVDFDDGTPAFTRQPGSIERLCKAAHLAENLEHLDSFIRCVNIRDEEVTKENKDANKLLASLNNITKHVQAGLTDLNSLDDVIRMGKIIAGGKEAFKQNPVISFITCVVKSPLQVVEDTAAKLMAIAQREIPVVISSSPMAGTTAPFDEFGMVAQINAEILAGITLTQLVKPGAPVLYGSVPVRCRLDTLDDMYGAPEFNHYNVDCAQMARYYKVPCYSTANVGDASEPGIQATAEKMLTLMSVPGAGAQYVHYAFGLLERTNMFCPEQAILDNAHIGMAKHALKKPEVGSNNRNDVLATIREVMETDHKTYMYHLPLPTREKVYTHYPLESEKGGAIRAAHEKFQEILQSSPDQIEPELQKDLKKHVPGILEKTLR
jgi:trimethylamine--corrinoid protein Co-methyltransferase